jgi:hypothetical protein
MVEFVSSYEGLLITALTTAWVPFAYSLCSIACIRSHLGCCNKLLEDLDFGGLAAARS